MRLILVLAGGLLSGAQAATSVSGAAVDPAGGATLDTSAGTAAGTTGGTMTDSAGGEPGGATVGAIEIERLPVFPDTTSKRLPWTLRLANRVHVRTRESVIRDEILFEEGMPLDTLRLRESERLLRRRGIFEAARVRRAGTTGAGGDSIRIRTQDLWTLAVLLSYEKQDRLKTFLFGIEESNVFGTGNEVRWTQVLSTDRDGLLAGLTIPRLAGTRAGAALSYVDLDDVRSRSAAIGHEPETMFDRWGYGLIGFRTRGEQRFYRRGEETGASPFREEAFGAHVGRFHGRGRLGGYGLGWVERTLEPRSEPRAERQGDPMPPAHVRRFHRGPILYLGAMGRRFVKTSNLDRYGTTEDLPLGWAAQVAAGPNLEHRYEPERAFHVRATMAGGMLPVRKVGAAAEVSATLFLRSRGGTGEWAVRAVGSLGWQPNRRTLSIAQIGGLVGGDRPATSVVNLGTGSGLRGFPAREFEAEDYLLTTFEQRFWSGYELLWTGFGANLFVDAALPSRSRFQSEDRWRTGWGFGVLLGLRKSLQRPIRIEVAWRTDRAADPTFAISTGTALRIVPSILLPSPTREFASPAR
jgi:hypothetical protein